MKQLLYFLFFPICSLQAQIEIQSFWGEMEKIRLSETETHAVTHKLQATGQFTVASNNFNITHARVDWYIDPSQNYIKGKIQYSISYLQDASELIFDFGNSLQVDSILQGGLAVNWQKTTDHGLTIALSKKGLKQARDTITIIYQGVPNNSGFGSFYKGTHGAAVPIIYTLSEPYGARDWWPCKNNLTDKIDSIDFFITTPKEYQPSTNGLLLENQVIGASRISHFKHGFPIATYLVGLAVTNYSILDDTVKVKSNTWLIRNYCYPESGNAFTSYASYYRNAMRIYSMLFGDYPFASEQYAHTQWSWGGGMEHQGNSFLNMPTPALAAHELAHQWFGDKVTTGSWQHIWLNEGFATYLTLLFNQYGYPQNFRTTLEGTYYSASFDSSGSVFVTDSANVNRIFNSRLSYNKGAAVLHMLRGVIGDSSFFRGVRNYLSQRSALTGFSLTEDFQKIMEIESGKDLNVFFKQWIYGEGYPNYLATWSQNKNNWLKLNLFQSTTHGSVPFFKMPVSLLFKNGTNTKTIIIDHNFNGQEVLLNPGFAVDTVIVDADLNILSRIKSSRKLASETASEKIIVGPNPAENGILKLTMLNPVEAHYQVKIISSNGVVLQRINIPCNGADYTRNLSLQNYPKGIYLILISNSKGQLLLKKVLR